MRVSLKTIANEANVSTMTASKILNLNEANRFRPETVQKVKDIAAQLGYTPNRSAQSIRTNRSGIIGLVSRHYNIRSGDPEGHPLHYFQTGLIHELGLNNQHIASVEWTEFEPENAGEVPLVLRQPFFDGLIVHFDLSKQAHHLIREFAMPSIYLDCGISEPENCLYRDERRITTELVHHILDHGYRNIAFYSPEHYLNTAIDNKQKHFSVHARTTAYSDTLISCGLKPVIIKSLHTEQLVEEILARKTDAVIIEGTGHASFHIAIARLAAKGILVGYASCDVEARQRNARGLAGMLYDRCETGRTAARMLQAAISSRQYNIPSQEIAAPFTTGNSLTSKPIQG